MKYFMRIYKEYKKKDIDYRYIRIGEINPGWRFEFTNYVKSFQAWKELIHQSKYMLYDENGKHISEEFLLTLIEKSKTGLYHSSHPEQCITDEGYIISHINDVR